MKKLVDLLKELEEKALDISWNPFQEKDLKDEQTMVFTIRHSRSGGKSVQKLEDWTLVDGLADTVSQESLDEIRSDYIRDCRAEAGRSEDDEDYDCDDIDLTRYKEDEGYFNIVNNTYQIGWENSYYVDNTYEFASEILKVLQTENPSAEQLYKYMI